MDASCQLEEKKKSYPGLPSKTEEFTEEFGEHLHIQEEVETE